MTGALTFAKEGPMKSKLIASLGTAGALLGALAAPAHAAPAQSVVQFRPGVTDVAGRAAVQAAGGRVTRDLHLIHAVGAALDGDAAQRLRHDPAVARVDAAARVHSNSTTLVNTASLATSYTDSVFASELWDGSSLTGQGNRVAR